MWVLDTRGPISTEPIGAETLHAYYTGAEQTTGAVAQAAGFAVRADDSGADELPADLKAFLARDLQRCTSPLGAIPLCITISESP